MLYSVIFRSMISYSNLSFYKHSNLTIIIFISYMDVKINYTWDCTQFTFLDMLRIMKTFHYQVVTILYMYNLLLTLPWLFMLLMIIFQFEVFLNKKKTFLVCNQFFLKHSISIQFNMTLKKSSIFIQTIAPNVVISMG